MRFVKTGSIVKILKIDTFAATVYKGTPYSWRYFINSTDLYDLQF